MRNNSSWWKSERGPRSGVFMPLPWLFLLPPDDGRLSVELLYMYVQSIPYKQIIHIIPWRTESFSELTEEKWSLTNSVQSKLPYLPLLLLKLLAVAPSLGSPRYTSFSRCQSSEPCVHTDCPGAPGGQRGPIYPPTSPVGAILGVGPYSQSRSRSTAFPNQGYLKEIIIS